MQARPGSFAGDQRVDFDSGRSRCPVGRDEAGNWILLRHDDVVAAALDPVTFSNSASRYLNLPNGLDGQEHHRYRELVDRYFTDAEVARLEPGFRRIAGELVGSLSTEHPVEAVGELGARFAVRAQSYWLGWPATLEVELLEWMDENRRAARSRDPEQNAAVAERFDAIIRDLIRSRREAGDQVPRDVTARLMDDRIGDSRLSEEEIVSILRNWTSGDLGSIAACIGVVVFRLASDRKLQGRWRTDLPEPARLDAEIEEILRADDPFTFNRRVTTAGVEIGGMRIGAGDRVLLNWTAANRDPEVFGDPDAFRPTENAAENLVFGTGPHVCPGRGLSLLEIRVAIEELLDATSRIGLAAASSPVRAAPPYGGFAALPVSLTC